MYYNKFFYIYICIIFLLQIIFFSIYNIPIFKIYCDLNNYYITNNNNNNLLFINNILYNNLNNYYNYISIYNNHFLYNEKIINYIQNYNFYYRNNYYYINTFFYILYNNNNNINLYNITYIIYFYSSITNINLIEFINLQNNLFVSPGETYLIFFRCYNPINFITKGISIYFINPNNINIYIIKIQCFCFDELIIYPFETIDLPVLFYISSEIIFNKTCYIIINIQIIYLFILNVY
jgi:cytochrome c oxidase assembly protein Cox11